MIPKQALITGLLLLVAVLVIAPAWTTGQSYSPYPTTSMSQLNFPSQAMSGSPITVTFTVTYNMGENMYLGAYIYDLSTGLYVSGCYNVLTNYSVVVVCHASPVGCSSTVGVPGCIMDMTAYSSGSESVSFTFNIASAGTYNLQGGASVYDNNQHPIVASESQQSFSITVTQAATSYPVTTSSLQENPQPTSAELQTNTLAPVTGSNPYLPVIEIAIIGVLVIVILLFALRKRNTHKRKQATLSQFVKAPTSCIKCGAQLPPASDFCNKCGTKQSG